MGKIQASFKKIKNYFYSKWQQYFVASGETKPEVVRSKQVRLGILVGILFVVGSSFIFDLGEGKYKPIFKGSGGEDKATEVQVNISGLAKGTENEKLWVNGAQTDIDALKRQQENNAVERQALKEHVEQTKISRDEVEKLIQEVRQQVEQEANKKIEAIISEIQQQEGKGGISRKLEQEVNPQTKTKKFGDYIPAGSYVEAKLIAGADAGVGVSAESNPRPVELRITGDVISAGLGKNYLRSNKLIGCLLQGTVAGEISSEKAYIKLLVMTCAVKNNTILEIPVKGYVTTKGKVGVRGEVISREGDLVLKSFLSGAIGGIGSGVAQHSSPTGVISGGNLFTQKESVKDIALSGFGRGVGTSSDKLSDYFIKRAEQYQPVISIDGGIDVNIVFQEGFSLRDEDHEKK